MSFVCNICGSTCDADPAQLERDVKSCPVCESTPRVRAVAYVLSIALFGRSVNIPDFPHRPDLIGLGLSDWGYAPGLAEKLGYRNTFFDEEPQLDITDPPEELFGTLDFLISSDVFEHVAPPVERAFEGAFQLLKPGGLFVLTVPYFLTKETMEHFPELHDYEIVEQGGSQVLRNRTVDGRIQTFDHLRFHGGPGVVLEMRILAHHDVLEHLRRAGFEDIVDWKDRQPEWGAFWREDHSFPIVARRPAALPVR